MTNDKRNVEYSWLQISDLHVFDNTEWNIIQNAFSKLPEKDKIKFIIVTGDLHQYGEDYQKTIEFLNKLVAEFKLTKRDIFIIPGNHDVGECDGKEAYTLFIDTKIEKQADCYRNYFVENKLVKCFEKYNRFIDDFYGDLAKEMYPNPEQVSVLKWRNVINIINLNSAIICDGNNKKKQIVDIYKLSKVGEELDKNIPTIIIAHHAYEGLCISHQKVLSRLITDYKVSAYLCGDLHKQLKSSIPIFESANSSIPCIVCGKMTPDENDNYSDLGCIVYSKEENSDRVWVNPYLWDKDRKHYSPFHGMDDDNNQCMFNFFHTEYSTNTLSYSEEIEMRYKNIESIWLPDAETAHGKQTRFGNFTSTKLIEKFIAEDSDIWGLSAVKGIGKTFVLQIKKTKLDKKNLCLPLGIKAEQKNNWGIDSIILGYDTDLTLLKKYENIVQLWKYSFVIYAINQLVNIKQHIEIGWWKISNPDKELREGLKELWKNKKIGKETYDLCVIEDNDKLDIIVKNIIATNNWTAIVEHDISALLQLRRKIETTLKLLEKDAIVIFVDKIDQTLMQTSAEPPEDCEVCDKRDFIQKCNNSKKNTEFCFSDDAACKVKCCYGCENYASTYSNKALRIYNRENKNGHVNLWQHFQLALVHAVSQLKVEYLDSIKIYFTIRQEAFACEDWILGEHRKKVISLVDELWYTKEQQKKIFYDCIKYQDDELLYKPSLKNDMSRIEEAFVGVNSLCHPYATYLSETVFDSIYRHSFDRTRDLQEYGKMLTEHMDEIRQYETPLERGERVKELIEQMAARLAFSDDNSISAINGSYYYEKTKLLSNHWANPDNFKKLILMFDKNLFLYKEARNICKRYNGRTYCSGKCDVCNAKHHPISMLFKLGMLGQMHINNSSRSDVEQKFLHSKEITYLRGKDLVNVNSQSIYILHPALTKSIELIKNKHIKHFSRFILGKGLKVPKNELEKLMEDYGKLSLKEFETKYYYLVSD